jgi:UDP-N-acetylglucosamine 1-carboxyvinyltransferase
MDYFLIKGKSKLSGEVKISGSKNASLPMLCASILLKKPIKYKNLPNLSDIRFMLKILQGLGAKVVKKEPYIKIHFKELANNEASYDLVRKMRASFLVIGPLLARNKSAKVSLPGGCAIGARPVELHLKVLEAFGAKISVKDGYVYAKAKELNGTTFTFPFISVGATQTAIMTAVTAKGKTVLKNVSKEPETIALAKMLNKLGTKITGLKTDTITIDGVNINKLRPGLRSIKLPPDRIEAATFMIAASITNSKIKIKNIISKELEILISSLEQTGVKIKKAKDYLTIDATKLKEIKPFDIETSAYPGFPTDIQAQWMAYMARAKGSSRIEEKMFENRFMHVAELNRLGADIKVSGNLATINGVEKLTGAPVMATDLRASASLVIAALATNGTTRINRVYHIDRGYDLIDKKLKKLGVDIERKKEGKV